MGAHADGESHADGQPHAETGTRAKSDADDYADAVEYIGPRHATERGIAHGEGAVVGGCEL
jgi:hypothetical protein